MSAAAPIVVDPSQVHSITVDPSQVSGADSSGSFLGNAGSALWDNIKGAAKLATSGDLWEHAIESAKAGNYGDAAETLGQIAQGPAKRVADSLVNIAGQAAGQMKDAASKAAHGDLKGAQDSANAAGITMGTAVLPHLEKAAKEYESGQYGPAAGDVTGDVATALLARGAEAAAPALVRGATAGGADLAAGAAKTVTGAGVAMSHMPGSFYGYFLGRSGLRQIAAGMGDALSAMRGSPESEGTPPPIPGKYPAPASWDLVAKSLDYKDYASVPDSQKALVRNFAAQVDQQNTARPASTVSKYTPPPPASNGAQASPTPAAPAPAAPGRTTVQAIDDYIRSRNAQASIEPGTSVPPVPESPGLRGPVRPPLATSAAPIPNAAPAAVPAGAPPGVSAESPVDTSTVPRRSMAQIEAAMVQKKPADLGAPTSPYTANGDLKSPELRAMEIAGTNRAAVAGKIAQHLYDNGITLKALNDLESNGPAWKLFWDNTGQIPGVSSQSNYSPSPATIDAARGALRSLEKAKAPAGPSTPISVPAALAKNPKALKIAQDLANELGCSANIGDLMNKVGNSRIQ